MSLNSNFLDCRLVLRMAWIRPKKFLTEHLRYTDRSFPILDERTPPPKGQKLRLFFTTEAVNVTLNIAAFLTGFSRLGIGRKYAPPPDRGTNVTAVSTTEAV